MAATSKDVQSSYESGANSKAIIELGELSQGYLSKAEEILKGNSDLKRRVLEELSVISPECDDPAKALEILLSQFTSDDKQSEEKMIIKALCTMIDQLNSMFLLSKAYDNSSAVDMLDNDIPMNVLKMYRDNEKIIRMKPDIPTRFLQTIFYERVNLIRRSGVVADVQYIRRSNTSINEKHYHIISLLMNCYQTVTDLDDFDDTKLDDDMLNPIRQWLEHHQCKIKSYTKMG